MHEGDYANDTHEEDDGEQDELEKNRLRTTTHSDEIIPLEHIPTPHTTGPRHAMEHPPTE
jgi:hypothetical protein